MDWEHWVHTPGLPNQSMLNFTTSSIVEAKALAMRYIANAGDMNKTVENYTEYEGWYSSLKVVFLETLLEHLPANAADVNSTNVTLAIVEQIDHDLNITLTVDPECKQRWYPLGI